ncbi:uncharacterized protein [Solanum lycopersicum]|uniref:uncharacterized protein n=1 Tax=Solanum lycopersicum TaxID=4081 RepID=UPI0037485AA3
MGESSQNFCHLNFFSSDSTNRYDQIQNAVNYCTQIVNNNVMGDERVGELHNDEPSEHELTDSDDMYDDDDDNVDNAPNAPNASVEDQSINYHSTAIPYLDHTEKNTEDFIYTRDDGSIRTTLWNSNNPKHIQSGMLFMNKMQMKSAVRAYNLAIKKEFLCDQSKSKSWKVICKRHELGYDWMIRFREISSGMWKIGKMIEPHTCLKDNYKEDHFNLNDNMIATSLIPYVIKNPDINIKMIREIIKGKHHYTPSYRKAQKGRRKTFRMVYGDFESSFKALPRYMDALQLFNPGIIIEWEHHSTTMQGEQIFKFLFGLLNRALMVSKVVGRAFLSTAYIFMVCMISNY